MLFDELPFAVETPLGQGLDGGHGKGDKTASPFVVLVGCKTLVVGLAGSGYTPTTDDANAPVTELVDGALAGQLKHTAPSPLGISRLHKRMAGARRASRANTGHVARFPSFESINQCITISLSSIVFENCTGVHQRGTGSGSALRRGLPTRLASDCLDRYVRESL